MPTLSAESLLTCWEHGCSRHPLDRALLLYALAAPAEDPDSLADRSIGERNAALLQLRHAMFGDALSCCVDCPACGERLQFALSAAALLAQRNEPANNVELDGVRFRMPTTRDLACIAKESDATSGAQKLVQLLAEPGQIDASRQTAINDTAFAEAHAVAPLQASSDADRRAAVNDTAFAEGPIVACAPASIDAVASCSPDSRPPSDEVAVDRLAQVLEQADACLDFALDLSCAACAHAWTASFDIGAHLWHEIDTHSRRLLDEIHILARSYGWTEREVLDLSDARRRSYIERALA